MKNLCIGVPLWGSQEKEFWKPLAMEASKLYKFGINLVDILGAASMATDNNRNGIVELFKKTKADWLFWWDTDNSQTVGTVARLIEQQKEVVGGIYFRRDLDHPTPIAYIKQDDGRYRTIKPYKKGEIISVDAAGMNCLLVHRSVFEDIENAYQLFIDEKGAKRLVHNEDIDGQVLDDALDPTDGRLVDGQLRIRLRRPNYDPKGPPVFPFFMQEYNRSEDYPFYEMIRRIGHQIWLDTSIECAHWTYTPVDGSHYRTWVRNQIELGKAVERGEA